jgi:SNF2 family DNA or RNA helicase
MSKLKLHSYQEKAISFILEHNKCALWLGIGLGKTIITLKALSELHDSFLIRKTLIIAPLRVANTTWGDEIKKWDDIDLIYSICTGSLKDRVAGLSKLAQIYIINRENIPWLVRYVGKNWDFDCVVIDESTSFKNNSTVRFKALRAVLARVDRMIQLTGTPAPNSVLDLWSQFYLLDNGKRLGRFITHFKQNYFVSDYMGYNWTIKPGAAELIYKKIEDIVLTLKTEDYMTLPRLIPITCKIQLPDLVVDLYNELEKKFIVELEQETISAANAAALTNKLLQLCNGAAYYENESGRGYELIHDEKLLALDDFIEDNGGENILIAYNYKTDLIRLQERYPHAVVLDKEGKCIEDWNNGKIKLLLAHPASCGHGLNLQFGGSVLIWFGLTWSLEYYQQFIGRLHRQGQSMPVRVVHLVCENSIEERVLEVLKSKDTSQTNLLNYLKNVYTKNNK